MPQIMTMELASGVFSSMYDYVNPLLLLTISCLILGFCGGRLTFPLLRLQLSSSSTPTEMAEASDHHELVERESSCGQFISPAVAVAAIMASL